MHIKTLSSTDAHPVRNTCFSISPTLEGIGGNAYLPFYPTSPSAALSQLAYRLPSPKYLGTYLSESPQSKSRLSFSGKFYQTYEPILYAIRIEQISTKLYSLNGTVKR